MRRGLQALSSLYVERRGRLARGDAFHGAGKRAAFALFYGPLHFLLVRAVVRALGAAVPAPARVLDLGCGTGVAGAAWALEAGGTPHLEGIERNAWAADEARWTLRQLGLRGSVRRASIEGRLEAGGGDAIAAAFTVNELGEEAREALRLALLASASRGARVLVVEPLARRALPWWERWAAGFREAGGREDEWRFRPEQPAFVAELDRAAGLDHRELGGRTLWLPGRAP